MRGRCKSSADVPAQKFPWKWRKIFSRTQKLFISIVLPFVGIVVVVLELCGGARGNDKYLQQFRMSFNMEFIFARSKKSDNDVIRRHQGKDIHSATKITTEKFSRWKVRRAGVYNRNYLCWGIFQRHSFITSHNFLSRCVIFCRLRGKSKQDVERQEFSTLKRVDGMLMARKIECELGRW